MPRPDGSAPIPGCCPTCGGELHLGPCKTKMPTAANRPEPPANYRKPRPLEYSPLDFHYNGEPSEVEPLREALTYYAEGRIWDNGEIAREALLRVEMEKRGLDDSCT